jgi:hypothetical protein
LGARSMASVTGTKFRTVFWVTVGASGVGACAWELIAHNRAALSSNPVIGYLIALSFLGFKNRVALGLERRGQPTPDIQKS